MQEMADDDPWGYRYDSQALAGQAHELGQQPFGERVAALTADHAMHIPAATDLRDLRHWRRGNRLHSRRPQ